MKKEEFKRNPKKDSAKSGNLIPSDKPVSFQIKTKDTKKRVIEYQSNILYKTAKADESDDDGENGENKGDGDQTKKVILLLGVRLGSISRLNYRGQSIFWLTRRL